MPQFLLFAALFWVTAAPSQTILRSVSDAHQLALSQNVGIQSSNLQDQMARFDRKSAVSSYLPNVQAQAQSDYDLELPVQ